MSQIHDVLRAGLAPAAPDQRRARVLLVGAGGPLGSAVLERLLSHGGFEAVIALATQPIEVAMAGLVVLPCRPMADLSAASGPGASGVPVWASGAALPAVHGATSAVIVFDREGSRNGREAAFLRPDPHQLPALAAALRHSGVERLVLVLPHAPGLLPQAVRAGLASLDEQAVAALGFEQLVLVRPARQVASAPAGARRKAWGARLAQGLLSQLHWLVPQREQPLRAAKVAEFVTVLVRGLDQGLAGVRVVAPEALWDWAQPGGGDDWLRAWLTGQALPVVAAPARRW